MNLRSNTGSESKDEEVSPSAYQHVNLLNSFSRVVQSLYSRRHSNQPTSSFKETQCSLYTQSSVFSSLNTRIPSAYCAGVSLPVTIGLLKNSPFYSRVKLSQYISHEKSNAISSTTIINCHPFSIPATSHSWGQKIITKNRGK